MRSFAYRYKIVIAYEGTHYCGWQVQPNGISIQSVLGGVMERILQHPTSLTASGRTDAGVHARGQVVHFETDVVIEEKRFLGSVNGLLPKDIRVFSVAAVPETFHSRYSAKSKEYHYHICINPVQDPFQRAHFYHCPKKPFDLGLLREAAKRFVGTHDFCSFANVRGSTDDTVRTIFRLDVVESQGNVRLEFEGSGFLYKMVRNIVGTLLEIARGQRTLDSLDATFSARDRRCAGVSAPPHGLFLMNVCF